MSKAKPIDDATIAAVEKPYYRVCQVCGQARSVEVIMTLTFDVSARFGLDDLIYMLIDHCFDRRECKQQALKRAKDFAAGN